MKKRASIALNKKFLSLVFLLVIGAGMVFAGNVFVNENGIQSDNFISNNGKSGITATTTFIGGDGETYIMTIRNGLIINISQHPHTFPTSGIVSYYNMDETSGSMLIDSRGSYNGTIFGASVNQTGFIEESYYFDGVDDYVSLGNNTFSGYSQGTISLWFKIYEDSPNNYAIFSAGNPSTNLFRLIATTSSGKLQLQRYGGGVNDALDSNTVITRDTWHNVVVISDGSDWKVYLDGQEEIMSVVAGSNSGKWFNDLPSGYELTLGKEYVFGTQYWKGNIDELGYWSRPLNSSEVLDLYNQGNGLTYS